MIKAITKWFKDRRERQFAEYLRVMEERQKLEEAEEAKKQEELRAAALALEQEKSAAMHDSKEPWIAVNSGKIMNGAMEFELDWNAAMIDYLKENGFMGDENQMIQKYLGALYREIYEDGKNDALDILKTFPEVSHNNSKFIPVVEKETVPQTE